MVLWSLREEQGKGEHTVRYNQAWRQSARIGRQPRVGGPTQQRELTEFLLFDFDHGDNRQRCPRWLTTYPLSPSRYLGPSCDSAVTLRNWPTYMSRVTVPRFASRWSNRLHFTSTLSFRTPPIVLSQHLSENLHLDFNTQLFLACFRMT